MSITETKQRLISADSHVTITDESFLEHLPTKYLPAVQDAIAQAQAASAALNMPNNRQTVTGRPRAVPATTSKRTG